MVGAAVSKIGTYNQLDNKQQKVALIDQEMCINCGEISSSAYVLATRVLIVVVIVFVVVVVAIDASIP